MTRVTVSDRQELPASGRYGMEMARSCLPAAGNPEAGDPAPGQGRPQAVAERCEQERASLTRGGVAEDAQLLGTATLMRASSGTGGYLLV